jgi:hypothetical protein
MTTDTKITSTEAVVTAAFALHQDRLADEAVASLQRSLERIKSAYSNLSQDVYSCPRYGQLWRATLRDLCVRIDGTYELDMDKAQAWAKTWAQSEIAAAAKKLSTKVGRLVRVKVTGAPERGYFTLTGGHPNGAFVRVEQDRILNVSGKGTLYNQWPARIYVDNRLISEAAYKRISPRAEDRILPEIGD